jgi:PAS domain S-box-containing protein
MPLPLELESDANICNEPEGDSRGDGSLGKKKARTADSNQVESCSVQQWLAQIVELIPLAACIFDAEGRITHFNSMAVELWGGEPSPTMSHSRFSGFREMLLLDGSPISAEQAPAARALALGEPVKDFEGYVHDALGVRLRVRIDADVIRDASGTNRGALAIFQNISRFTQANDAMRLLAAIVESSDDAIISKNLEGIITSWNQGAQRIFGYSSEEAIGRSITMLIPEDRRDEEPRILSRIRRGERIDHYETLRRRKDGELLDISLTVSPIKDDEGNVIGASKIARDIGRLKLVEEELRMANERKNQFLATLAHELRAPLAPLRSALDLLNLSGDDPEISSKARAIMDRQVRQMVRLVEDLFDLGRISNGKLTLKRTRVDIRDAVRAAIETCLPAIESAGHAFHSDLPGTPIPVDADPARLAQIFCNLINNAVKYTPRGGRIDVAVSCANDEKVRITVADNGVGIPPDMRSRIFDLFTQLDRPLERSTDGLGLGLALTRQLVTIHGGEIDVRSEGSGKGSEFIVDLPLAGGVERLEGGNVVPLVSTIGCGLRVLVVDDNTDSADALSMMLSGLNNVTRVAHDGTAAVEAAGDFLPDVIFMDIEMPRLSGFDACRRIRERAAGASAFVVALTGRGQEEDEIRSRASGFDMHLVKPVEPDSLLAALDCARRRIYGNS